MLFRNRSFNLSYRGTLLESEEIIRGRMVRSSYDSNNSQPAEISVEQKYAESLDIDLGDQITIEVSGVKIDAKVVNIRRVTLDKFSAKFFVQMQPGVLERAPKTFIGTIDQLSEDEKILIQDLIVQKFPTISILDVERTGKKILQVITQMTWALKVMAILSILVGLIILHTISVEKARRQRNEINLQKILGASFSDLRNLVRIEFGSLGFSCCSDWSITEFRSKFCHFTLYFRSCLELSLGTAGIDDNRCHFSFRGSPQNFRLARSSKKNP